MGVGSQRLDRHLIPSCGKLEHVGEAFLGRVDANHHAIRRVWLFHTRVQ